MFRNKTNVSLTFEYDFQPGIQANSNMKTIANAIDKSKTVLFCVSTLFLDSEECQFEVTRRYVQLLFMETINGLYLALTSSTRQDGKLWPY